MFSVIILLLVIIILQISFKTRGGISITAIHVSVSVLLSL